MKESRTGDEQSASSIRTRGAPLGTHSLTGSPTTVGIPAPAHVDPKTTQPPSNAAESADAPDAHVPVPDEDGPHDVPDEKVIEKTLPSVPVPDSFGNESGKTR